MAPNTAEGQLDGAADSLPAKAPSYESFDQQNMGFDAAQWCSMDPAYPDPNVLNGQGECFPLQSQAEVYPNAASFFPWPTHCNFTGPLQPLSPWTAEPDSDGDLFSPISDFSAPSQQFQFVTDLATMEPPAHATNPPPRPEQPPTALSPAPGADDTPTDNNNHHHPHPKRSRARPHGRKHGIQLRTAARKRRRCTTSSNLPITPSPSTTTTPSTQEEADDNDLTTEERRARRNHNLVEKQYRNRLNAQFDRLLATLPVEHCRAVTDGDRPGTIMGGGFGGGSGDEKRMSKAEVLDLATRWIKTLEGNLAMLLRHRGELEMGQGELVMVAGGVEFSAV